MKTGCNDAKTEGDLSVPVSGEESICSSLRCAEE